MKLIAFVILFLATTSQAAPVQQDERLVCKNGEKSVFVYSDSNQYQIEVDDGSGAVFVAVSVKYHQDMYVGHVTESTRLESAGFTVKGPLTLKADSLVVQDPYTGSASVVWNGLACETKKLFY